MKNIELQKILAVYPADMPIKIRTGNVNSDVIEDFDEENIVEASNTAYVDDEAPEEEWDHEYGKIELGDGERYLLINPIIM